MFYVYERSLKLRKQDASLPHNKIRDSHWQTIGHNNAVQNLLAALNQDRFAHAYLITGERNIGKTTLAIDMAASFNCESENRPCGNCLSCKRILKGIHLDIRTVSLHHQFDDKNQNLTSIGISQIKALQREAALTPFEGQKRVYIILDADNLSEEAGNSLLKTLEEPPPTVIVILTTSKPGSILETVQSRCQLIELKKVPTSIISKEIRKKSDLDKDTADQISNLVDGRPGLAIKMSNDPETINQLNEKLKTVDNVIQGNINQRFQHARKLSSITNADREESRRELLIWSNWWRDVMYVKEGLNELVKNKNGIETISGFAASLTKVEILSSLNTIRNTQELIDKNVNPRLALETMMINLPNVQRQK